MSSKLDFIVTILSNLKSSVGNELANKSWTEEKLVIDLHHVQRSKEVQ